MTIKVIQKSNIPKKKDCVLSTYTIFRFNAQTLTNVERENVIFDFDDVIPKMIILNLFQSAFFLDKSLKQMTVSSFMDFMKNYD